MTFVRSNVRNICQTPFFDTSSDIYQTTKSMHVRDEADQDNTASFRTPANMKERRTA